MSNKRFHRDNFSAHTGLEAIKANAIELCGREFCDQIKRKGISANTDEFWKEVNRFLNIPSDAYEKRQAEEERKQSEERERLLDQKKKVDEKRWKDWEIIIYELPESEIFGKLFIAECIKKPYITLSLSINNYSPKTIEEAYRSAYSTMDRHDYYARQEKARKKRYQGLKPLYLMVLYLSGYDNYLGIPQNILNKELDEFEDRNGKENFLGVEFFNGLDHETIYELAKEDYLTFSSTQKTVYLNKKAIREARQLLKNIDHEGIRQLLADREYHEEYINYKSVLDRAEEHRDEEGEDLT